MSARAARFASVASEEAGRLQELSDYDGRFYLGG
jgi:hypothetical protein